LVVRFLDDAHSFQGSDDDKSHSLIKDDAIAGMVTEGATHTIPKVTEVAFGPNSAKEGCMVVVSELAQLAMIFGLIPLD
jgi:hypothetical protein